MTTTNLVLLPGMDGTSVLFAPLLRELDKSFQPSVVSYPPDVPLSYEQLLPLVRAALPLQSPFILLGESFSGPLAIMAAAEKPTNLLAVILCASFMRNPLPWLPAAARHFAITPFIWLAPKFIIRRALISGYGEPSLLALLTRTQAMVKTRVMAARARAILSVNVEVALSAIEAPIFVIAGANDKVVLRKNLREILRVRPDVHPYVIPGPHLLLQARPIEAATLIKEIAERAHAF